MEERLMVGSVDVPEKLGVRTIIGPFDLNQMMRIAIYLLVVAALTIFLSIYLIILSLITVFAVYFKIENEDSDLYFLKYLRYKFSKKRYISNDFKKLVEIYDIKENIVYLGSLYLLIIETTGLNLKFYSEEEQKHVYLEFINILNGIDFDFDIKIIASKFDYNRYLNISEKFEEAGNQYVTLIKSLYTEQVLYKYYIILKQNSLEFSTVPKDERLGKVSILLNNRAEQLINALKNIKIDCNILKGSEILEFYSLINEGV
ncbi:MAG: hypothetical protein ACP5NL_05300 [Thermoplasmata archaeon]